MPRSPWLTRAATCPSPRCSRKVVTACQASPMPPVPRAGAIWGHSVRLAPARIRPAPSAATAARRSNGNAAMSAERASVPHTSLRASAAAMARTRHSVSGATTSQQAGTALATMAGSKLKKAAVTGPAPTRPRGAALAAKYPDQKPRQAGLAQRVTTPRCEVDDGVDGFGGDPQVAGAGPVGPARCAQRVTWRTPVGELSGRRGPPLDNGSMSMRSGTGSGSSSGCSSSGRGADGTVEYSP